MRTGLAGHVWAASGAATAHASAHMIRRTVTTGILSPRLIQEGVLSNVRRAYSRTRDRPLARGSGANANMHNTCARASRLSAATFSTAERPRSPRPTRGVPMAKGYWINVFQKINDPKKVDAYR